MEFFQNCKCTCKIGLVWIGGGEMGSVISFILALFMITCYYLGILITLFVAVLF